MAALQPILGHSWGDNLANFMLVITFYNILLLINTFKSLHWALPDMPN